MAIAVAVGLLSGRTATVKAGLDEEVGTLKRRAQTALGSRKRAAVENSSGSVLDVSASIKRARLQNGESLVLHIGTVQLKATQSTFAAILGDGSVVTWGHPYAGGDSNAVRERLKLCSRPKPLDILLLPFSAMDPSSHGVVHGLVVTAVLCRIS